MKTLGISLLLLASVAPVFAQEPATEQPLMRIDVVGPAAFRAAFLPTNIGSMFASKEGERLWRPLLMPAEHIWKAWDGSGDDFQATRRRVLDYAGRIRVLWLVEPGDEDERDRLFGVFALDPDGSTNMGALTGDLVRPLMTRVPGEPKETSVGQHSIQLLDDAGGDFVTVPMLIDGRLVAFFGERASLDTAVPRCLRALAADVEPPAAPISLHVDLSRLKELQGTREEPELIKLFGLRSLESFHASVRPNGPYAQLEFDVEFGDGERGMMAAFFPEVGTLPGLLARVPAEATPWLTIPFRADVILHTVLEMVAEEKGREGGIDAVREEMRQEVGLYLDTELLDHLGGEVLVLGDLWQSDDPEAFRSGDDLPLGACIAFSLKDTAAFNTGFEKLMDSLKGTVNRFETREVDGVRITRLGSMFLTGMHMAVGQDLFAMGFGDEGVAQLEALVAGRQAAPGQPLPPPVQRARHLAPAGFNGVGVADLRAMLSGQVALVMEMLDEALPRDLGFDWDVDTTQEWLDMLLPLVEKHHLEHVVTMTGFADGRWRLRLLW